jgi:hypothetical protein
MKKIVKFETIVLTTILITTILSAEKCDYVGGTGLTTFTGMSNDPAQFELQLEQSSSNKGVSLALWVKVTGLSIPAYRGIIARYYNRFKIFTQDVGGVAKVGAWAWFGPGNHVVAEVDLTLNTWTLIWFEVAGTSTFFMVRDAASGQVTSESATLSKLDFLRN